MNGLPNGAGAADVDEVVIGVIAPLTGGAANLGQDITRTVELFKNQLTKPPRRFRYRFVFEDHTSQPLEMNHNRIHRYSCLLNLLKSKLKSVQRLQLLGL